MKSCINGATTMPYSLEEDIVHAGRAGFEAVELWTEKVETYLTTHTTEDLKRLLENNSVTPASICPFFTNFFRFDDEALRKMAWGAQVAQAIGCDTLLACPDAPPPLMEREEAYDKAALAAKRFADLTASFDTRLALEPLARHPFIPGCTEALEVIQRADHDHLGLMMDTFHYYASGVTLDDIRKIPADKLFIVHLNDSPDRPREELNDGHRVYMTLGIIPLVDELRILKNEVGYTGPLSVELFNAEYWQEPIEKITSDSKKYYDILMGMVNAN